MTKITLTLVSLLLLVALLGTSTPNPVLADDEPWEIQVNSTLDLPDFVQNSVCSANNENTGPCTLRAALDEANKCSYAACGDSVTILLPAGTYTLSRSGKNEDNNATGDLDIVLDNPDVTLVIQGAGAENTIIDANGIDRVFHVLKPDTTARISDVTIRGGALQQTTNSEWVLGAGIYHSDGVLNLNNDIIENNSITCAAPDSSLCHQSRGGGINVCGGMNF